MPFPHPATILSGLALFVALGGPAQAANLISGKSIQKNSITNAQIRDRTLGVPDLSVAARAALRANAVGSVASSALANNAVTDAKIAAATITGDKLAAGTITARELAPGVIGTAPAAPAGGPRVGGFDGSMTMRFSAVSVQGCSSATSPSLTPTGDDASLLDDVVLVTPAATLPSGLSLTAKPVSDTQVLVELCNPTTQPVYPSNQTFRYVTIDG